MAIKTQKMSAQALLLTIQIPEKERKPLDNLRNNTVLLSLIFYEIQLSDPEGR